MDHLLSHFQTYLELLRLIAYNPVYEKDKIFRPDYDFTTDTVL